MVATFETYVLPAAPPERAGDRDEGAPQTDAPDEVKISERARRRLRLLNEVFSAPQTDDAVPRPLQ